jgi:diguanylate cyclase (GGDEF)-like protein/PAS domain S-box-containing protein
MMQPATINEAFLSDADINRRPLIMVVEDNPITRKSVRLALQAENYRVAEAETGAIAIAQMRAETPDLVLLDLLLPDIHGVDLIAQLRAMPGGGDIPILAFSGFISKMEEARIAGAGFTDFLLKPLEPSRLVRTVASFLAPRPKTAPSLGAKRRLLLADDDPVQLKLLRLQFEHAGFTVQLAHDGAEALAAAQREPPDLIVADVLMPDLDGYDLCLAVRNDPRLRSVPLILVSANYLEETDQSLGVRVGACAFLYRDQGFEALLRAAQDSMARPVPGISADAHELKTERHTQIVRQLERQVGMHAASAQRNAIQSAILHELSLISETLAKRQDLESALDEILAYCLDGAGLSKGALYLIENDTRLVLSAQYGCTGAIEMARAFFGVSHIFQRALQTGLSLMVPSADVPPAQGEKLLGQAQAKSALIIPVRAGDKDVAVLLLLSLHRDLLEEDWIAFGRSLAAQIGQAVALSRAFYRLAESEQRYRSLFEAANDGICVTDDDGRVVDANPAICALAGYSPELFRGMDMAHLLTGAERENWPKTLYGFRRTGNMSGVFSYTMQSGTVKTVEVQGTRVMPGLYLNIVRDITERRRAEQTIHDLAYRDTLTGLSNRVALQKRLEQGLAQSQTKHQTLALILLNLDNFRDINETLGHPNGDLVLKHVAARLQEILWEPDMVARLAADEFALLLPRLAEARHIKLVVDKITQGFKAPFTVVGIPLDIQPTLGVALSPEHGTDADTLFQRADIALHSAKKSHRRYAIYDPAKNQADPRQLALIAELREAIQSDRLVLHYQPKINAQTNAVIGMEALVRWPHAVHGMIPPDDFIPMAERTGLINPLTAWVLRSALRQTSAWSTAGKNFSIAINLSTRDLQQEDIAAEIQELVHCNNLPPARVTLEITEGAAMVNPKRAHTILGKLRAFGIRIAIDDFGTGHSSLAYLKQLPADQLKIDKSFVMDIKDKGNAAIVRSTIELAHHLGLEVTAEGVEDKEALQDLKTLGCDVAQGYYIGRPMPAAQIDAWCASWTAHTGGH